MTTESSKPETEVVPLQLGDLINALVSLNEVQFKNVMGAAHHIRLGYDHMGKLKELEEVNEETNEQ